MAATFPWGWWSFDLGEYRRCDGTYALYRYDSLPPLAAGLLRGDFAWLTPVRARHKARKPAPLFARTAALGLVLPPAFERFMGAPELKAAVPSCTACEWDLGDAPQPCRVTPGAYTIRFLRDQQDCLFWYLYVRPDGTAPVLCSPIPFDEPGLAVSREVVLANSWLGAPDFEAFVYRFWIENELWELLDEDAPELTAAQRAYVEHYAAAQAAEKAKRAAKRAAAKATTAKKAATKKATTKKATTKKAATKKATTKKGVKKVAAKKQAVKKVAKKKAAKKVAKKVAKKKAAKKVAKKKAAKKATGR